MKKIKKTKILFFRAVRVTTKVRSALAVKVQRVSTIIYPGIINIFNDISQMESRKTSVRTTDEIEAFDEVGNY